jgi:ubiquinone/menaquinone biosynthesis C-methylase UbiE
MSPADRHIDPDAFNRFEAASWDEQADAYHRFAAPITTRVIEPLLDAAGISAGMRVLDVATGPGYAAAACADRGAEVVGVDVAGEMVSLARRLNPAIEFRRADAERLPFDDGWFDAAVGNFFILHVGRPEQAAAELARVLAPDGKLALSTWDDPERARLLGVLVDAVAEAGARPPPHIPAGPAFSRFADDGEFARLLSDAGLADVGVETLSFTHHVADGGELWDGLSGGTVRMRALVQAQPDDVLARIRAAFDRLVRPYAADDGLELPVSVKIASGRKRPPAR